MKIVSFNVNGLRARLHQIHAIITQFQPDIIALQETKVHDDDFPIEKISQYGYNVYCHGQKKHYGVALLSHQKGLSIKKGFSHQHKKIQQARIMMTNIKSNLGPITIINGYFPQGENINHPTKFEDKKIFYQNVQKYIEKNYHTDSLILLIGDMNISPSDLDIGIDKKNQDIWIKKGKCSFLKEERNWINQLLHWGLIDIFRHFNPENNNYRCYSWFDYRSNSFKENKGLRIDLMLATQPLVMKCQNIDIKYEIRAMKKPSDHVPILAEFNI